ncbi:MAG: carbamoyltransferase HypF [Candidatus Eremiobacteraeota bacterium]|nr:carbamoyltransferase HypF [Candidatus Eremiobacteraeota bacterium]MBC5826386.1 carbamoyltransferase HypF [Candidatus Eremiobacteraeota bacterium]
MALEARRLAVRGVIQGVGFRPFVFRLARSGNLAGWVLNGERGVDIHVEGSAAALADFEQSVRGQAPPAAKIESLESRSAHVEGFPDFVIRESEKRGLPSARISPDLPVCGTCLGELFDPGDRRFSYPYVNCTDCGPRYSIILALPYDRPQTTMGAWAMCVQCRREYQDSGDRRFHAQPTACPKCGPAYFLRSAASTIVGSAGIREAAELLRCGRILAVKGLGGYHLACDARNAAAVAEMRSRKYRKERPFAVMARDLGAARELVQLDPPAEALLTSAQRPIVLAPARARLDGVAPDNREIGVMLPYTPLQHLLFAAGAPDVLVMTSANRSSEPIAYRDEDAFERLSGIADAFLVGEREIARRIDDSVARAGPYGPAVLRHARGYAPGNVAQVPASRPILAVGADLKNTITLVVDGQAFVSQHIGDLDQFGAFESFKEAVDDLCSMYEVRMEDLLVVHDAHPQYASTEYALSLPGDHLAVQHHRAHVASVLAERGDRQTRVAAVSFDGTGYGDDGTIWGGEFFVGNLADGFVRAAHLRSAMLPGGDGAARHPAQCAAGFLAQISDLPDMAAGPFHFPRRYRDAHELLRKGVRSFATTSVGRLFDAVAALVGFTREISFEGQAAMWLEHLAWSGANAAPYPFPLRDGELDFRPLLQAVIKDRLRERAAADIALAFHLGVAKAVARACATLPAQRIVLSGGVFQNALLLELLSAEFGDRAWINHRVPPNDGGISLGQAAIAAALLP